MADSKKATPGPLLLPVPEMTHAADINPLQWSKICSANQLFYGWIAAASSDNLYVKRARDPALKLKDGFKPEFVIEDSSYISVQETTSTIEDKLVWKGFSESGIKAYLAGGSHGFTLGGAGELSWDREDTSETGKSASNSKLHCAYNFPRVVVYLSPQTLELSGPCKSFLEGLENPKDIDNKVLERFFLQFGGMLPTKISLGGRLYTAESSQGKDKNELKTQKREMKRSVALNFMAPMVGAGLEAHKVTGNSFEAGAKSSVSSRNLSITAQGGNTLLSWSYPDWALSVGFRQNWRAINQDNLEDLIPFLREIASGNHYPKESLERLDKLNSVLLEENQKRQNQQKEFLSLKIGNTDSKTGQTKVYRDGKEHPEHAWTVFVRPAQSEIIQRVIFTFQCPPGEFPHLVFEDRKPPYERLGKGYAPFWVLITLVLQHGLEMREMDGDEKPKSSLFSRQVDYRWLLRLNCKENETLVKYQVRKKQTEMQN